jgi:hypothetical protein
MKDAKKYQNGVLGKIVKLLEISSILGSANFGDKT